MYFEMIGESNSYHSDNSNTIEEVQEIANENYENMIFEAYFGKTKDILAIENKISEIRSKYPYDQMKFNTSKDKEELEDLFCKAFGFECCSIHVEPSYMYNAYTIPISNIIFDFKDYRKYIVSENGKGFKYKKEAKAYLIIGITRGLLFDSMFTDAEVTAILLHEVGHNFQTAISGKARTLNMIPKVMNILLAPAYMLMQPAMSPFRNMYIDMIKYMEKEFKGLVNCFWAIKNFINLIGSISVGFWGILSNASILLNPLAVIKAIPETILINLGLSGGLIFIPAGLKNEIVSDAFATSYGYGVELSSALSKITKQSGGYTPDQIFREMGIIGAYFDLVMIPNKVISNAFDPHPNTVGRIKNQYKYLSEEMLKNEHNPKMKREIQKQINELDKLIDEFVDVENDGFFFSNKYDKLLLKLFGGDFRTKSLSNNVDKEFDASLLQSKNN